MFVIYLLVLTGTAINLALPIKHFKSKYFFYFLLIGLTDISGLILIFIINQQPNNFSLLFSLFLPISLFHNYFKKNLLIICILFILFIYPILNLDAQTSLELQHPFDIALVFILLWQNSKLYLKENVINLFSLGILFFVLAKFLALIGFIIDIETNTSVIINYIAVFSQIIIGIFLLIFSEDNPKVIFRVSK
jgi:hypothetical protein